MSDATFLGIDFGLKRIGIAVGQTITHTAKALGIFPNNAQFEQVLKDLIQQWKPKALVIGKPLNMDGTEQAIGASALAFSEQLRSFTDLPIHWVDERLSTVDAKSHIFEQSGYRGLQKGIDAVAAQLILEDFLRTHHG